MGVAHVEDRKHQNTPHHHHHLSDDTRQPMDLRPASCWVVGRTKVVAACLCRRKLVAADAGAEHVVWHSRHCRCRVVVVVQRPMMPSAVVVVAATEPVHRVPSNTLSRPPLPRQLPTRDCPLLLRREGRRQVQNCCCCCWCVVVVVVVPVMVVVRIALVIMRIAGDGRATLPLATDSVHRGDSSWWDAPGVPHHHWPRSY